MKALTYNERHLEGLDQRHADRATPASFRRTSRFYDKWAANKPTGGSLRAADPAISSRSPRRSRTRSSGCSQFYIGQPDWEKYLKGEETDPKKAMQAARDAVQAEAKKSAVTPGFTRRRTPALSSQGGGSPARRPIRGGPLYGRSCPARRAVSRLHLIWPEHHQLGVPDPDPVLLLRLGQVYPIFRVLVSASPTITSSRRPALRPTSSGSGTTSTRCQDPLVWQGLMRAARVHRCCSCRARSSFRMLLAILVDRVTSRLAGAASIGWCC